MLPLRKFTFLERFWIMNWILQWRLFNKFFNGFILNPCLFLYFCYLNIRNNWTLKLLEGPINSTLSDHLSVSLCLSVTPLFHHYLLAHYLFLIFCMSFVLNKGDGTHFLRNIFIVHQIVLIYDGCRFLKKFFLWRKWVIF